MKMRWIIAGVMVLGSISSVAAVDVLKMQDWTIVCAPDATSSENYAAEEFQKLFKEASGFELLIKDSAPGRWHTIFIGPGAVAKAGRLAFDTAAMGEEGLRIRIGNHNIAIAGGLPRGTLYGVYEFFDRYLGVRFLTADHTYFPERSSLAALKKEDYSYIPTFSFRWPYYWENSNNPGFAAKLHVNTVSDDEKLGGKTHQNLINHSLYQWINPGLQGQTHPEYFALVDGQRKLEVGGGGPEPCVTNPEVIEIVADGVIKALDANPKMQNISVSQNDNDVYCRCPKCEEITQREGTPMGPHLAMVNAVAERVEKKHPKVKIGTLAYWYTRKPPKTIAPRDNMQIQLCSIECCTFHALDDPACPLNQKFCSDIQGWKAMCKDIWIWNYNTNFSCYDLPFPNLRSIGANVRFFLNNNVKGVFMQANGNGSSGEMSELRNYVISRCLWHPGQESWPLVEEFCRLHYAESAQPILDYLTMLHDNTAAKGKHPNCFPNADAIGIDPDVAKKAFDCFEQAVALAKSDAVRARVEKASVCAYKAMIVAGGGQWAYKNGACRRTWNEPRFNQLVDRYISLCQQYNVSMENEGRPMADYIAQLKRQNALKALRIENDIWRLTVLPEENGKLVEMFHKPTHRNLLNAMTHNDILRGTIEDIGLKGYDQTKPLAFAAEVKGSSIQLTKVLEDGSTLEHTIALKASRPDVVFCESVLTHQGKEPKAYQLKAHPEFDPLSKSDSCDVVSVYIKDAAWTRINREWKMETGVDVEILNKAKGGAFAFFSHAAKFGVQVSYDPKQYERPYLWWHPPFSQINLELFTPEKTLKPGQSLRFAYQFSYLAEPPK